MKIYSAEKEYARMLALVLMREGIDVEVSEQTFFDYGKEGGYAVVDLDSVTVNGKHGDGVITFSRKGKDAVLHRPFDLGEFVCLAKRMVSTGNAKVVSHSKSGAHKTVEILGKRVEFSLLEYEIYCNFCENPERVFSEKELLERFFPDAEVGSNAIKVYINYLRKKLASVCEKRMIITVRGKGYYFKSP